MSPPTHWVPFLTVSQHLHYMEVGKEQGGEVKWNGTRLKQLCAETRGATTKTGRHGTCMTFMCVAGTDCSFCDKSHQGLVNIRGPGVIFFCPVASICELSCRLKKMISAFSGIPHTFVSCPSPDKPHLALLRKSISLEGYAFVWARSPSPGRLIEASGRGGALTGLTASSHSVSRP